MQKSTISQNIKNKIEEDPDFILLKRFDYSLKRFLEKHQNGTTDKIISQALGITPEELKTKYTEILSKLKNSL